METALQGCASEIISEGSTLSCNGHGGSVVTSERVLIHAHQQGRKGAACDAIPTGQSTAVRDAETLDGQICSSPPLFSQAPSN